MTGDRAASVLGQMLAGMNVTPHTLKLTASTVQFSGSGAAMAVVSTPAGDKYRVIVLGESS